MSKKLKKIEDRLFELQDLKYKEFHRKLIPDFNSDYLIGVRTPQLRQLAKEFSKDPDCMEFMKELPHKYYDENNLHGYLIEIIGKDFDSAIELTEKFLPYINNWATCDTFHPKAFKKDYDKLYCKTLEWINSNQTYTVRYGIVTQLQCFLDEQFRPEMLEILSKLNSQEYYVNMAIAWYYSFALIKQYETTIKLFQSKGLDKWIHNKSLQKAIESYRIDKETKDYLRSLKIK